MGVGTGRKERIQARGNSGDKREEMEQLSTNESVETNNTYSRV